MTASSDGRYSLPEPSAEGELLAWLLEALPSMNRTRVKQMLRNGRISVNGTTTTHHRHPLRPGDRVEILRVSAVPICRKLEEAGISIVLEDEALIVIDKPPGLLTVATDAERIDTAFARLNAYLAAQKSGRPYVVHRLDRETSGLLLFAKSAEIRDRLQANWREVAKTYLAVVEGRPRDAAGMVENFLTEGRDLRVRRASRDSRGAHRAVSRYEVTATLGRYSLVQVVLETGRKHQIRVHLAELGCPVIGDPLYGSANSPAHRLGLHAWRLAFVHPTTGNLIELESPLPAVLERLFES